MVDPKVIDAELAELSGQAAKLERNIRAAVDNLHSYVGDKKEWIGKNRYWVLGDREAELRAAEGTGVAPYDVHRVAATILRRDTDLAELKAVRDRMSVLDQVYRAHRWSRFFLVTDGHIHSSTSCHTCRPTTEFGWLPQLSGETEAAAVAAHGALLCTVCYPTAPVEWTNKYEVDAAAKKAAACPGSGNYASGIKYNRAVCTECGTWQTTTSTGKLRTHKKGA